MVDYYCYLDSQVTKKDYQNKLSNLNQRKWIVGDKYYGIRFK